MEMEPILGRMVHDMRGNGKMVKEMERERLLIRMVENMQANGKIVNIMAKEYCMMQAARYIKKGLFKMMNLSASK